MLKEEFVNTAETTEPKRYKYVLNGGVFYFTREELKEHMKSLHIKNNLPHNEVFIESIVESRIKMILKYDGDPYGDVSQEEREMSHKLEANGFLFHIGCFY
ncbi:MAG: hypothetical protein LBP51_06270 [Deferribacteraceae bacterium]|jgi:YHS domain-containing protein|nr:hypothetical protein [Deferribacteraceae bacterium]